MYNIGDVLLYKLDSKGIKKGERFYIEDITESYFSKVFYHVYNSGEKYTYTLTEEYINQNFITLAEHRKNIIEELL